MARLVRLRPWQKAALDLFLASPGPDFLAVATPGAGKTTFALTAARQILASSPGRLIVVAPTQHLKTQWARAAAAFDLHLEPEWSAADGRLPPDMHGIVTTYAQVATSAGALRRLSPRALVVFDEIHHAGDDKAWGSGITTAFELAGRRLALSGTPFRSDTVAIPFVRYEHDLARPDFEYGYGEALADTGVVRPVFFPRLDGHMEWVAPDGSLRAAGFADVLDRSGAGQRLKTALSLSGEWLPAVLAQADETLRALRVERPDAAGLVIASDREHARGIAELLRGRLATAATVVTSDDSSASARISQFAAGSDPWLVAVRMVSEGVDIPRLHVGVYATTTTTELFFRQAVGRIVRWTVGLRHQRAYLFIPDDARLRALALTIAEQRRHSLVKAENADSGPLEGDPLAPDGEGAEPEQLSLFTPLSAVAIGQPGDRQGAILHHRGRPDGGRDDGGGDDGGRELGGTVDLDMTIEVHLPPAPSVGTGLPGAPAPETRLPPGQTLRERKQKLRAANTERARWLSRATGLTHAQVNVELNRLARLERVTEATVEQLQSRLDHAERWLSRSRPPASGATRSR